MQRRGSLSPDLRRECDLNRATVSGSQTFLAIVSLREVSRIQAFDRDPINAYRSRAYICYLHRRWRAFRADLLISEVNLGSRKLDSRSHTRQRHGLWAACCIICDRQIAGYKPLLHRFELHLDLTTLSDRQAGRAIVRFRERSAR